MKKDSLKILKQIQASVPKEWREALMDEQYIAPDLRNEALIHLKELEDDMETQTGAELEETKKAHNRLKNIIDAGYYDAKEKVVNPKIAKKIEDYVEKEIRKAMKDGKLPKKDQDTDLKDFVKKIRKYERKDN